MKLVFTALPYTRYLYYIVIFRSTRTKKTISGKDSGLKVTNGSNINIINGHLFHIECPFKKHFLPDFFAAHRGKIISKIFSFLYVWGSKISENVNN